MNQNIAIALFRRFLDRARGTEAVAVGEHAWSTDIKPVIVTDGEEEAMHYVLGVITEVAGAKKPRKKQARVPVAKAKRVLKAHL